jgi:beta-glucanase (GH16 family)
MKRLCIIVAAAVLLPLIHLAAPANAADATPGATQAILDLKTDVENHLAPSSGQVTFVKSQDPAAPGIEVTIQPGKEQYPGINLKPAGTAWDLSAFGHVTGAFVNTGKQPISLSLRVDNAGNWQDGPWNTESVYLKPGQSGDVTVIFGFAYGHHPNYALKSSAVVNMLMFASKSDAAQSFRIVSIVAGGPAGEKPPVDPNSIRIQPPGGLILGGDTPIDAAKQIEAHGAHASMLGHGLSVDFPPAAGEESAQFKPPVGRWDLRDDLEVRVKVHNAGQTPVTPRARVESNGGPSDWASSTAPLAPGEDAEIAIPFVSASIWDGANGTGNRVTNDAVSGITVSAEKADTDRVLQVESIRADMPAGPNLPDWLGKRPPIEGDWVKTFDDEFNAPKIDASKWNIYGENYWDKESHFSKADVIVGGGLVKLRFEKKLGHQNDDPKRQETNYAVGYLDTFGKWTQRYGYFEARMKLPTAPGLWPAFWMMPDRGAGAANRQDTGNNGMEFDIMEHLDRWGPNRYNIAMHWDGYGKDHKSTGSDKIYVQPDKDGYITCGLLWTPGSAVYYCTGKPVLRWDNPRVGSVPEIMMFTMPMGGWDNNALDDARLPDDFSVDYVRVWQRKDLATPGVAIK